jgi:SPX domain protein involved in polyphosphate accumulation
MSKVLNSSNSYPEGANKIEVTEYRNEIKIRITNLTARDAHLLINSLPSGFKLDFPSRTINNLYLDTANLDTYIANLEGHTHRHKIRIRWYGNSWSLSSPIFEKKIKCGTVGYKERFILKNLTFDEKLTWRSHLKLLLKGISGSIKEELLAHPTCTLINRYTRFYYRSLDKQIRLTLDTDLQFFQQLKSIHPVINTRPRHLDGIVIEIKGAVEDYKSILEVASSLPFRITKSSKYVESLQLLLDEV